MRVGVYMSLMGIQESVQQIADAIAAVLKIEVEIADKHLFRVAGTGKTRSGILRKMEGNLVYDSAIRTGRTIVIENPGFNEVCHHCTYFQNCSELGEICTPIKLNNEMIGVIGLLAFNEKQKKRLFSNVEDKKHFLNKMADLIASKLKAYEMMVELKGYTEKLYNIMNMVDQGIIILNSNHSVEHINMKAKIIIGADQPDDMAQESKQKLEKFMKNANHGDKQKIRFNVNGNDKEFLIFCQNFVGSMSLIEKMIVIQDLDDIQEKAEFSNKENKKAFNNIVGTSTQMKELKDYAYKVSRSNSTVFIQGESGTGKEEFARAIHFSSERRNGPFITVNCGAIPENLLESELFGYAPGAFTGANKNGKKGKFEIANKGTIFLDEIGEMPQALQVKILRVIQQREIEQIGGNQMIPIDVRIIAATNRNVQQMVKDKEFREDLFYRLNVIPILLPPLRNRPEDIMALVHHFIKLFNQQFRSNVLGVGQDVRELLLAYSWPGNARELRNFIEYIMNFITHEYITLENAGEYIQKKIKVKKQEESKLTSDMPIFPSLSLEEMEKKLIKAAIDQVKQNGQKVEEACHLLGISRATLFRKIKLYQL
ncbi:sigma-54-dependent Fis family transcriptional regulator [Peribacillus tepidiphilus]|uniref:sigma-54-dependent Fis family transcriptional regulator n=1 Tax=Peribacillus tepidiphilus TaxID=2652445 RepID=UPI001290CEB3|nr:sigma 54-interacting transcriptional regulator [Peribacillus tepidiphilus]